jgi:hypothetical protein
MPIAIWHNSRGLWGAGLLGSILHKIFKTSTDAATDNKTYLWYFRCMVVALLIRLKMIAHNYPFQ